MDSVAVAVETAPEAVVVVADGLPSAVGVPLVVAGTTGGQVGRQIDIGGQAEVEIRVSEQVANVIQLRRGLDLEGIRLRAGASGKGGREHSLLTVAGADGIEGVGAQVIDGVRRKTGDGGGEGAGCGGRAFLAAAIAVVHGGVFRGAPDEAVCLGLVGVTGIEQLAAAGGGCGGRDRSGPLVGSDHRPYAVIVSLPGEEGVAVVAGPGLVHSPMVVLAVDAVGKVPACIIEGGEILHFGGGPRLALAGVGPAGGDAVVEGGGDDGAIVPHPTHQAADIPGVACPRHGAGGVGVGYVVPR